MATDFTAKSNASIDRAVTESTSFEALREAVKSGLERAGSLVRDRDGYGVQAIPQEPAPASLPAVAGETPRHAHLRVVYPSGNLRIELTGVSEKELDEAEAQLRETFAAR